MRVDLRRRQARMPEHFLDASEVGSSVEQVGRERVPHIMGRVCSVDAGRGKRALEHLAQRVGRHRAPPRRHEEARARSAAQKLRTRVLRIGPHRRYREVMQGNDALFGPLPHDANLALSLIHI